MAGNYERRLLIAPVATTKDIVESEHLAAREFFEEVPDLAYKFPGRFAKASNPLLELAAPPRLGQHTDEIMRESKRGTRSSSCCSACPNPKSS